jgi:hypothetical protein
MLSGLRPYRRRLIVLVVLAALAGAAVGELAPARRDTTSTKTAHRDRTERGRARR